MTVFGDDDPLDAWDPDDPIPELVRNLLRRIDRDDVTAALVGRLFADDLTHVLERVVAELGGD